MGEIPGDLVGQPAWALVSRVLPTLSQEEAIELAGFGTLWLDDRLAPDPMAKLGTGAFRLNMPRYKPVVYYEIDPGRLVVSDGDIIVYDKESGPSTVPAPYDAKNNLVSAMERRYCLDLRAPHRLDAATSGLVILAVNRLAASRMGKAFQGGKVRKRYLALSRGPKPAFSETMVRAAISKRDGRYWAKEDGPGYPSQTRVTFLRSFGDDKVLFMAEPLTGRTHQIRLHLAFLGYPIAGDRLYGGEAAPRLMLRASGLSFRHPGTGEPLTLGGPWPEEGPSHRD
jgi:23S rRNA-/tRNA-specific pseudouridylate synthase